MATDRHQMHRTVNIFMLVALMVLAAAVAFQVSNYIGEGLYPLPFTERDASEDVWFDSDTRMVVSNMTDATRRHWKLYKHPLFSGIFFPMTYGVAAIVGDTLMAVHLIYAANAPITVLLLWLLLARVGVMGIDRSLICLLFIVSSAMLFWYSIPETFPISANGLLVALHAAISTKPRTWLGYLGHALASLATFSITITNWVAGIIATTTAFGLLDRPVRTIAQLRRGNPHKWGSVKTVALISASIMTVAVPVAFVQFFVFAEASVFFYPPSFRHEASFMFDYEFTSLFARPFILLLSPIVVGTLGTWNDGTQLMAENFVPNTWYGLVALCLWTSLLLGGAWAAFSQFRNVMNPQSPTRRLAVAASLSLLFMLMLHLIFGYMVFLYVAHTLPYVLVLVGLFFLTPARKLARVLIVALIAFALAHNVEVLQASVTFVDQILPRQS